jgi:hypothetical protein
MAMFQIKSANRMLPTQVKYVCAFHIARIADSFFSFDSMALQAFRPRRLAIHHRIGGNYDSPFVPF